MSESDSDTTTSTFGRAVVRWLFLICGVSQRVTRRQYAVVGITLMLLKYAVECLAVWYFASAVYTPLDFVNPLLSERTELLAAGPPWLPWAMFVWSLPFLWIALSMSVRRVADAGVSPWVGFLVLIPIINLGFMIALCSQPSRAGGAWMQRTRSVESGAPSRDGVLAVIAGLALGGVMMSISVYLFESYGAALFVGTPLMMSATAAYIYNRNQARTLSSSLGIAVVCLAMACVALLLFALEGIVCIAMAAPLLLPIGVMGGLLGKAIADSTRSPQAGLMAAICVLPAVAAVEAFFVQPHERVVTSAVDIDASAAKVWEHVVSFPQLPAERAWYFRLGIACPERARIEGEGVGAVRYCEFTTGQFVEPIKVWDEPRRLAFDVTEQPDPMFELSPYRGIRPPHLDHHLRSHHGEFALENLPDGRTRLVGRTWYTMNMFPQAYWTLWSDLVIHRIHERVLMHIQQLAESATQSPTHSR